MTAPDPMKGIRGVFAAVLVLEAIVVLLALLVFARFGSGPPAVGVGGDRRAGRADDRRVRACSGGPGGSATRWCCSSSRSWPGSCWSPPLGVVGVIFALVWVVLLLMRRDVARKMARGELPSQRGGSLTPPLHGPSIRWQRD